MPLIGGSGGGGFLGFKLNSTTIYPGVSGGAGGGAILLASTINVAVNGSILAKGGKGVFSGYYYTFVGIGLCGGSGSGGGVRLVAPTV